VRAYVRALAEAHPELEDMVADPSAQGDVGTKAIQFAAVRRRRLFSSVPGIARA
jgi:hypothetical protein